MTPSLRSNKLNGKSNNESKEKGKPKNTAITTPTTTSKAASKRTLSSVSPDAIETNDKSKKTKTNKVSTMSFEQIKELINESTARLENKIGSSQSLLESKISDLSKKVEEDVSKLESTVVEFHGKINDELNNVKKQLSMYSERIDNSDDDFQRIQRNQDLRISGFAFKEGENLYNIFTGIAGVIGFNIDANTVMPSIERMLTYNKETKQHTPSQTILVHFAILRQKQQFYSQ